MNVIEESMSSLCDRGIKAVEIWNDLCKIGLADYANFPEFHYFHIAIDVIQTNFTFMNNDVILGLAFPKSSRM